VHAHVQIVMVRKCIEVSQTARLEAILIVSASPVAYKVVGNDVSVIARHRQLCAAVVLDACIAHRNMRGKVSARSKLGEGA